MKSFLFLIFLGLSNSFNNNFRVQTRNMKLNALKNYNEKPLEEMDIFEKFEKYSSENNKEKQAEYYYKIHKHLKRIYNKKTWEEKKIKNEK